MECRNRGMMENRRSVRQEIAEYRRSAIASSASDGEQMKRKTGCRRSGVSSSASDGDQVKGRTGSRHSASRVTIWLSRGEVTTTSSESIHQSRKVLDTLIRER